MLKIICLIEMDGFQLVILQKIAVLALEKTLFFFASSLLWRYNFVMLLNQEEIYREYHDKVLRYILSKINNYQLSEDLTSDVFLKIYEKGSSFDDTKASLSTWIYSIARNRLIDYYRSRKVMVEIPDTLVYEEEEEQFTEDDLKQLAKALEKLDLRSKKIIVQHYYADKSLKDIAEEMQLSYAYVKILHKKALAVLYEYCKKD